MSELKDYSNNEEMRSSIKIATTAMMTVLVCIVTMMFSVYLPSSRGFFNIGETMIYISAILFGPYVGAISGGIGSMFADILLGYVYYAPGTVVIKGIEGFVVGFFYHKLKIKEFSQKTWHILTLILGVAINGAIILIGLLFYQGVAYIGGYFGEVPAWTPEEEPLLKAIWEISAEFHFIMWFIIGIIGLVSILIIGYKYKQDIGLKIIAMVIGGLIIVVGYFSYATFILRIITAFTEIPFNFLQSFIGILIAVPTISSLEKYSGVITFTRFKK